MKDAYERLQKIDQALNEEDGFLSTLNKKVDRQMDKIPAIPPGVLEKLPYLNPMIPRPLQDFSSRQMKTFMTGTPPKMSYQSNKPYERPKLATRPTDPGMSQLTPSQRLAARQSPKPEPYDPQPHKKNVLTRAEYLLRDKIPTKAGRLFDKHSRTAAKIALGVGAGSALAAGAIAAAPAVAAAAPAVAASAAPLAQRLTLSAALRYGGGRALQAGAGRAATQTGIRATASRLGSKALETVRKTALGRLMTGKFAQAVGREAAIYGVLSKLGVFGGGDGGAGGEAGVDDIGTKKLKPKSIGDLEATSAGRDFEAEYGGTSLKKLRGR